VLRRALLLALPALAGCGDVSAVPTAEGQGAIPVEVVDLAGLERAVAEQRGAPLLLNFWATWCPPCVAELPDLAEVAADFAPQGARVLLVSYDFTIPGVEREESIALVHDFLTQHELALPSLVFDGPDFEAINERFDLPGPIPVTLAYDRQGNVVDRHVGEATRARFVEMMKKALGQ